MDEKIRKNIENARKGNAKTVAFKINTGTITEGIRLAKRVWVLIVEMKYYPQFCTSVIGTRKGQCLKIASEIISKQQKADTDDGIKEIIKLGEHIYTVTEREKYYTE